MTDAIAGGAFADDMARVGALLEELERTARPDTLERVRDLVRALLDVHASALGAMVDSANARGAQSVCEAWALDPRVASVLVLHGLHPVSLETRVREALTGLRARGVADGDVEVISVDEGLVRVRIKGAAARVAAEEALCRAAPDATLEFEEDPTAEGFVPAARLSTGSRDRDVDNGRA